MAIVTLADLLSGRAEPAPCGRVSTSGVFYQYVTGDAAQPPRAAALITLKDTMGHCVTRRPLPEANSLRRGRSASGGFAIIPRAKAEYQTLTDQLTGFGTRPGPASERARRIFLGGKKRRLRVPISGVSTWRSPRRMAERQYYLEECGTPETRTKRAVMTPVYLFGASNTPSRRGRVKAILSSSNRFPGKRTGPDDYLPLYKNRLRGVSGRFRAAGICHWRTAFPGLPSR